ncbi:unnamed protein product [Schistosoma turkestanicum]|nr:unnamed protein product [Schistosoma turkestanicum]
MNTKQCTVGSKANKPTEWIACDKVVVRDQVRWQSLTSSKPVVSVHPTLPAKPITSTHLLCNPTIKLDKGVQTDDNLNFIFHTGDIIRTQRNLASVRQNSSCLSSSNDKIDDKESLQKALELQQKINADLKNLLVSALSGNLNVAQQLIDLMNNNANLYGQSEGLAQQKSILQEAANTAEIVADVWQTKCIASHVIASEAVKQAIMSIHQAHLARHALAHLLGERAQIRRYLNQTIPLLSDYCNKNNIQFNNSVDQTYNTLSLTSLCFDLASAISPNMNIQPIHCNSDTLGEELAQYTFISFSFLYPTDSQI